MVLTDVLMTMTNAPVPAGLGGILDPDYLISRFGDYALIGVAIVVFIETGLLFPFLPGDSLLFTAGMLVAQGSIKTPIWLLCTMLFTAAFLGDQNAYWIGRKFGIRLFSNPNARILNPKFLVQTQEFFQKHGSQTIILARFVPIVRTFAPVALGMAKFPYRKYVVLDIVGGLLWAVGVTVLGYYLGNVPWIKANIEKVLILIVGLSVVPIFIEVIRSRMSGKPKQS